jgi:hypothetical protein
MTSEKIKIKDNFLNQIDFDSIQSFMMGGEIPWYFKPNYDLDNFQFTHTFYADCVVQSEKMQLIDCILKLLQPVTIMKIRGNLLIRIPISQFHTDLEELSEEKQKQWLTSIFYINTNNGHTSFEDGTKVESVANRMLIFPANMKHTETPCTDNQRKVIINFNYYTR